MIKKLAPVLVFVSLAVSARAQTLDDGIMVDRQTLFAGGLYGHESWDHYWEGTLNRENGNIGTVTTKPMSGTANYGLSDRLNVIAMVPYVWTSQPGRPPRHPGLPGLDLAAKWSFLERPRRAGAMRTFSVVSAGIPLTDYNTELLPLSIGTSSTRLSWTRHGELAAGPGWFVDGSTAYTWRSDVELDRPYFFTDDEFVMSDEVDMPNVFDYVVQRRLHEERADDAVFAFSQQRTLGGGDIRRQDMPFVSNRMNLSRAGAW